MFPIAGQCAHHDGNFQVASRVFDQLLQFVVMKAGTAQKLVLNMISTTTMIRLGMTYSNWMINVTMTNSKLRTRGVHMLCEILGVSHEEAQALAERAGGRLKVAVVMGATGCSLKDAEERLLAGNGNLRKVLGHLGAGRE